MDIKSKAKAKLLANFKGQTNGVGYTPLPQNNLLPGISLADVEDDLRRGDGNELESKFCAVHSSSALAVNTFALYKVRPNDLMLFGVQGAKCVEFEKRLRIFRGGKAPNIDVWIERDDIIVAVESKFLEYFTRKAPNFSAAYERLTPPISESCWWDLYQQTKHGAAQYLDRAQLIKHYFGLKKYCSKSPYNRLTLLYLFWEPMNWQGIKECIQHRAELEVFANTLSGAQIKFRWMPYNQLWDEWSAIPALAGHAQMLKNRYQVSI